MKWYQKKEALITKFFSSLSKDDKNEWLEHRALCDKSLFYFILEVGGYMPKSGGDISPLIHKPVLDRWQDNTITRQACYMARSFKKSTCLTQWYSQWAYLQNNEIRILIASEREDKAMEWVSWIENQVILNQRLRWLYPELTAVDDTFMRTHRWSGKRMDLPRAGVYPESTVSIIGIRGGAQGGHYDEIICDDLVGEKGMESDLVLDDAERWFDNCEGLLIEKDPNLPDSSRVKIVGCLTGDTDILMGDNTHKKIDKVSLGDIVITHGDNGEAKPMVVEAVIPQGVAEVWEANTIHNTIRGTENHPILLASGEWKKLSSLVPGDMVVASNIVDGQESIGEIEAWFLGLFTGDGSCIPHNGSYAICISDGVHEKTRAKTLSAYKKLMGREPKLSQHKQWMLWDKRYGERLESFGLCQRATVKTIPELIFKLNHSDRIAYIRGLMDADGCPLKKCRDAFRIEVANERLVRDLKRLCHISGVASGRISHRTRTIKPPHSPIPVTNTFWGMSVNFNRGYGVKDINRNFKTERIVSIRMVGQEEVYDLSIKGNHNFIANGLVVHNTHWAMGDFGHYVQKEYKEYKWMIVPCLKDDNLQDTDNIMWIQNPNSPHGESNWPEMFATSVYREMMANPQQEMTFWTQYMNNPKPSPVNPFDVKWLKYYRIEERDGQKFLICKDDKEEFRIGSFPLWGFIDPGGFAQKKTTKNPSRFGILVGGQPAGSHKKFVTYAKAFRFTNPDKAKDEVFAAHDFFKPVRPQAWFQEVYAQQMYILMDIKKEAEKRKIPLQIAALPADERKDSKALSIDATKAPMFNGEIYVHESMSDLRAEISNYGSPATTQDLFDLLSQINKHRWKRNQPAPEPERQTPKKAWASSGAALNRTGY